MSQARTRLCWPRTVAGRRLVDELARCDREIAAMHAQTGKPAWLTTLGIEDWRAERRLIEGEMEANVSARKDRAMVIPLAWWKIVRERFDEGERAALHCAVTGETVSPAGVTIDPRRLARNLREKVEDLLNGNRFRSAGA